MQFENGWLFGSSRAWVLSVARRARRLGLAFLVVAAHLSLPSVHAEVAKVEKKLVQWGWDEPTPSFMRENWERMEQVGFDGVVFHVEPLIDGKRINFAWNCWSTKRFEYSQFASDLTDLGSCSKKRMTDNFLRFNVCPGDVDWFDDAAFANVVNNARLAARFVNDSRSKGIMLDVEMYQKKLFSYVEQKHHHDKSFSEYEDVVRRRGQEFMRALAEEFPTVTVLLTFSYDLAGPDHDRANRPYGLLKNFLDGMFEVAPDASTIVDAHEDSYAYRLQSQYRNARRRIKEEAAHLSAVPEAYRKKVQVGFGVWMDMNHRRYGWNLEEFERNYFTPKEFAYTVSAALAETDRYVWVYSEVPRWWTNERVPAAYRRALRSARAGVTLNDATHVVRVVKGDQVRASLIPGNDDEATFGDLRSEWTFVADLPRDWKYRKDPAELGENSGWFASTFRASSSWARGEIGRFWEEFSGPYIGAAWYRLEWKVPQFSVAKGQRVALWFGAVDESARVWVNGRLVGSHNEGPGGWDKRFHVDVTGSLFPGQINAIAVLVSNTTQVGGIWKPIKLAVSNK